MNSVLHRVHVLALALVATLVTLPVQAQTFPTRPVKIIVPFAAGGPADNFARFMGQCLQDARVAHPSVQANTLKELLALATKQPGKLNYASSGPGTPYHMAGELVKSVASVYLVHIPYRGSTGARTDVIGGQVDLMFDAVTTMVE